MGCFFEALCLDGDGIAARMEVGEGVVPAFVGYRLVKRAGGNFCSCDFGIGNGCTRSVGHRPQQCAAYCLPRECMRESEHQKGENGPENGSHYPAWDRKSTR